MNWKCVLTITGIQILNRYFHSGLDWCVKFHTNSVKLFSRENCWRFLIIIELKIYVDYHRHSDIKQIFSFRAWLNVWNFIQILSSCFREKIVDLFWLLMNWKYVLTITGIQILNRYFHSGLDRMCEISYKFCQVVFERKLFTFSDY